MKEQAHKFPTKLSMRDSGFKQINVQETGLVCEPVTKCCLLGYYLVGA